MPAIKHFVEREMKRRIGNLAGFSLAAAVLAGSAVLLTQESGGSLQAGFENPPDSAKPRTWWHWTNGNVTEDGISKDLEWMKRPSRRIHAAHKGRFQWMGK